MTPKEKAIQLVEKYSLQLPAIDNGKRWVHQTVFEYDIDLAKQCALIAVDEVIKSLPSIVLVSVNGDEIEYPDREKYWQQVKQEIEAL